jgi:hypothetical protein
VFLGPVGLAGAVQALVSGLGHLAPANLGACCFDRGQQQCLRLHATLSHRTAMKEGPLW